MSDDIKFIRAIDDPYTLAKVVYQISSAMGFIKGLGLEEKYEKDIMIPLNEAVETLCGKNDICIMRPSVKVEGYE